MRWPPPAGDLDEDDDDEPDGSRGGKACLHKYVDPSWAWSAFYEDKHNLRDSWCMGRDCPRFITTILCSFCGVECSKVSYEVSDEDNIRCCIACYEADEIKYKDAKYQKHGHGETISVYEEEETNTRKEDRKHKVDEEDLSTNSNIMEGPHTSAQHLPSSPCQPPFFSPQQQRNSPPPLLYRVPQPQVMGSCTTREPNADDMKNKSKEAEEDFIMNSNKESPQSSADRLFSSSLHQPLFLSSHQQQNHPQRCNQPSPPPYQGFWRPWEDPTPAPKSFKAKLCLSPISPVHPPGRLIRQARRRRRSPGDLVKRRQRLLTYQYNQSHLLPHTPEPEQSTLESGSWVGGPLRLDWSGITDFREYLPPAQTLCSSSTGWMSSPSPVPPTPPVSPPASWLSSNMAPTSPAYCDGCQRWGNLLSVTVSQSRGI